MGTSSQNDVKTNAAGENVITDVENWKGHEEKLKQLFSLYHEKVNPLVSVYNALENAFPIGVVNELRDVFSHLTRSLLEEGDGVEKHLDKAYRHMKRAAVDAFKYASMAYSKVYDDFRETYKYVDLGYLDNGKLLPKLTKLNAQAEKSVHEARMTESNVHTDEEMYAAYETAFNDYAALYNCVMNALESAEALKLKVSENEQAKKREHRIDRAIGIIGALIGVAGIVIGFFI